MYILLVAATSFEIQPTMAQLPRRHEMEALLTGVGSIPTTWSLMRQIGRRRPDCIIQAGIAGCFIPGAIGQVMAIKEEAFGDVGVQENGAFKSVFDLHLMDSNTPPFTNGRLVNPYKKWLDSTGLQQVRAITINEISTTPSRIEWYQQNIAPVVESMEGAAHHYVCLQENIPFLQLRSVSNDVGQRDKSKWDFKASIAALNSKLAGILEDLTPDIITL
ncbi:MAG: futalosine hydrolase [Sphingobacteriales bacterium 50-39]|nr:MAG: futalosine hydrolase [Sphingobacteriales bacterium 50-39]